MIEELMRLLQELLGSDVSRNTDIGFPATPPSGPSLPTAPLPPEENIRSGLAGEEWAKPFFQEEAYRNARAVPPDADMQRLREEVYRIPSPSRVEMFDPAVGGSVATTRDDPMSLLLSLLR